MTGGKVVRRVGVVGGTRVLGYQEEDANGAVLQRYYLPLSGGPPVPISEWPVDEISHGS